MSFVRRLVLGSILILVLTVGILFGLAERSLRGIWKPTSCARWRARRAWFARPSPPTPRHGRPPYVGLASQTGHRISLIDRSGWVRADSDFPPGQLPPLENHSNRPEVQAALRGGRGSSSRRSASVGRLLMYVAIPGRPGRGAGGRGAGSGGRNRGPRSQAVAGAALLALLIGSVLALAAGRSIARPLVEIGSAARAIADGAPPRFPHSGIPDIDRLVQALREMHRQLADRFARPAPGTVGIGGPGRIHGGRSHRRRRARPHRHRQLGGPPDSGIQVR